MTKTKPIRVTDFIHADAKALSARRGISLTDFANSALVLYMNRFDAVQPEMPNLLRKQKKGGAAK